MKHSRESGQALVEFIIFLPLMLTMYSLVVIFGDAINGSINQQKATRGYFYFRIQNSPYIVRPLRDRQGTPVFGSWESFGMFFVGWADYLENEQFPVYPCYRLNLPFAAAAGDRCEQPYSTRSTQFIRVGTVYGACGASMGRSQAAGTRDYAEQPQGGDNEEVILGAISEGSCLIR